MLRARLEPNRKAALELLLTFAVPRLMIVFGTGPVALAGRVAAIASLPPEAQFAARANRWIWL